MSSSSNTAYADTGLHALQAELADLRIAAKDIGRRITQYEADGRNARIA